MTAADVLEDVRGQLQDPNGVRWSNAELLRYLDDAVKEAARLCPYVLVGSDDGVATIGEITGTGSTVDLPAGMRLGLVFLVCWAALSQDADDRADLERARAYRQMGLEQL